MFKEGNPNVPSQSRLKYYTEKGVTKVKEYRTQITHAQIHLNASDMFVNSKNVNSFVVQWCTPEEVNQFERFDTGWSVVLCFLSMNKK